MKGRRKSRYLFYTLCLLSYVLLIGSSEGAFRDSFSGARSMAMGGAYTALANDADGVLANPAGLSMIKNKQVIATGAILYAGLSDSLTSNILGYAYQSGKVGALGAIWKRFSAGDLYHENIVFLSYARRLGLYFTKGSIDRQKNVSLGIALRFMSWDSAQTIGPDGRIIEDLPGWRGISGDIGLVIWPSENKPVEIVFQNVTRHNTASKVSKVKERLPIATRMGVATIGEKTTWAMDMILKDGEIDLRTGLERQMYNGDVLVMT